MEAKRTHTMPDFCSRRNQYHYTTAIIMLMNRGVDIDKIDILAVGEYENYKGEIRTQSPKPGTPLMRDTAVRLEVGFSSAVDIMPYQFFYGLQGHRSGEGWEMSARQFMSPFDASVIRHEALLRFMALRYNFSINDDAFNRRFLGLFDFNVEKETTGGDSALWATLMPGFHSWSGNAKEVEKILERIFGYTFRLVENIQSIYDIPEDMHYRLGTKTGRLGHETVLGRKFEEYDTSFGVQIHGVKQEEVAEFLPGRTKRKNLDTILRLMLPEQMEYRISFVTTGRGTKIGDKKTGAYLGYATRL
ncbi:MAG: type VI secretion system baseplate subunit TssG [Candidatus Zixiibacteriota bacterium]